MDLEKIDEVTRTSRDEEQHDKKLEESHGSPQGCLKLHPHPKVINTDGLGQSM